MGRKGLTADTPGVTSHRENTRHGVLGWGASQNRPLQVPAVVSHLIERHGWLLVNARGGGWVI